MKLKLVTYYRTWPINNNNKKKKKKKNPIYSSHRIAFNTASCVLSTSDVTQKMRLIFRGSKEEEEEEEKARNKGKTQKCERCLFTS
jgi:hypothetical protein